MLALLRRRADVAARTLIAVGAYTAAVDSFLHEKEPEDEPMLERTIALLDNRSRNYAPPKEVAVFYEAGANASLDASSADASEAAPGSPTELPRLRV